jgi:hypothetical protein
MLRFDRFLHTNVSGQNLPQVLLPLITNLFNHVKRNCIPPAEWNKHFVIYNNMSYLNRTNTTKAFLPLLAPYNELWHKVSKVIDVYSSP